MSRSLDPVTLEILWSRLVTVCNEQAAALQRTSFTPIVRESGDLSAAVFDAQGRMLAQAVTGTPGHINSLATGMRHLLQAFPPETLRPGDVLITNDPWKTSGQLNDLSVVTPVFRGERLVGFFGNTCHAIDIGGRGLSADATEVYEEGLYIPITKLYDRGEPNEELLRILAANVRAPEEVLGDIHAQVAGNRVGVERLLAYLDEFGLEDLEELGREILGRSEARAREAIAALPDGDYEKVIHTDGLEEPVRIQCRVSIRGDEITVDYEGSSPQVERGMNVVLNYTAAYTSYALKCAIWPEVPHNDGSFRPVRTVAPEGSILNPRWPAAVAARHIVGHFLPHAIFGALVQVIPDRVIAEGAGNIWLTTVRGAGRNRFITVFFAAGGTGARPTKDGLSCHSFPSGIATAPVEVIEATSPLVFRRKELRRDSGGPGRFRGGLGQAIEVEVRTGEPFVVSSLSDRMRFAAQGYLGGKPGARGGFRTSLGTRPNVKLSQRLPAGTRFTLELPGGGGFHDPLTRDPEAVARDVAEGFVSPRAAEREYGVRVSPTGRVLGLTRERLRRARPASGRGNGASRRRAPGPGRPPRKRAGGR
ncbi:MAG TPA: hydantoinase B/oxoprolinase family protein [Actinomycetota bacterium]|nr:hydantoinase B/oxoprolinase family protein [Actinomycetota bacterium]